MSCRWLWFVCALCYCVVLYVMFGAYSWAVSLAVASYLQSEWMWMCVRRELTPHDQCVEGALVSLGMASCETERNPTSQAEDPMWLHCSQPSRQTHTCKEKHRAKMLQFINTSTHCPISSTQCCVNMSRLFHWVILVFIPALVEDI